MSKEKADKFAQDITNAIGSVLVKHGFTGAMIEMTGNPATAEFTISIKPTSVGKQAVSANAIKRYQDHWQQMGLPIPGTKVAVGPMTLTLRGLSTDRQRVKATGNGEECHEIPVEVAKALAEASTAVKVGQMEAKEAEKGDTVDPAITEVLAKVMGGK